MAETVRPAPKRTPRLLVVEDERRMRDLLRSVLPEMGYEPIAAAAVDEAEQLSIKHPPDMLLLDLNLPVTDGMTWLRRLREHQPDMPVVILTGFGDLAAAQEAIHLDVVELLTKPAHLGQIEAALDRARRRLPTELPKPATDAVAADASSREPTTLAEAERRIIFEAIDRHAGRRLAAARALGISRRTLYSRLERYGRSDG